MSLLLPHTDAGVAIQAALAFLALGGLLVVVRHDRDLRMLVLGVAVFTLGFFGLRALH